MNSAALATWAACSVRYRLRGPAVAIGDVLGDRAIEEKHVLFDDSQQAPDNSRPRFRASQAHRVRSCRRLGRRIERSSCRAWSCPIRFGPRRGELISPGSTSRLISRSTRRLVPG